MVGVVPMLMMMMKMKMKMKMMMVMMMMMMIWMKIWWERKRLWRELKLRVLLIRQFPRRWGHLPSHRRWGKISMTKPKRKSGQMCLGRKSKPFAGL